MQLAECKDLDRAIQLAGKESGLHSSTAEEHIIAGILSTPSVISEAVGRLEPEHFHIKAYQVIFRAMLDCFNALVTPDVPSVLRALQESGGIDALKPLGGPMHLNELTLSVPLCQPEQVRYWSRIIRDYACRRSAIEIGQEIIEDAANTKNQNYLLQGENLLFLLSQTYQEGQTETLEPLDEAVRRFNTRKEAVNNISGLSTGLKRLDIMTGGFQAHQLITLSARPGGGKTALAANIATHTALEEGKPVLYFTLEMSSEELMDRVIRSRMSGTYDTSQYSRSAESIRPHSHRFMLREKSNQPLTSIQSEILKAKKQRPDLGLIVIDHLGLIPSEPGGRFQSKAYEIQEITRRLKAIAKTIKVPILLLAQMNRAIEARADRKPMLSDLRDSGSIEMDSDIVMFIDIERDEDARASGHATLTIAKHRNGELGEIPLHFRAALTSFQEKR